MVQCEQIFSCFMYMVPYRSWIINLQSSQAIVLKCIQFIDFMSGFYLNIMSAWLLSKHNECYDN